MGGVRLGAGAGGAVEFPGGASFPRGARVAYRSSRPGPDGKGRFYTLEAVLVAAQHPSAGFADLRKLYKEHGVALKDMVRPPPPRPPRPPPPCALPRPIRPAAAARG